MRTFKSYGESGDANNDAVQIALPGPRQRLENFSEKDIFNADECGLNYKMGPERNVVLQRSEGREKMKDRFTMLVCFKEDGSENFELMFV